MSVRFITKEQLKDRLRDLARTGWIQSVRPLNAGGVGNTIDALLGVSENNLPIADTAQWELKSHRVGSSSLLTLLHMEPEPRSQKIVTNILLPKYGWPDQTRPDELSFRQTICTTRLSDRGFGIKIDRDSKRVFVFFDYNQVDQHHKAWLKTVEERVGLGPIQPQPFWEFQNLFLKAQSKLLNTFYVEAEAKKESGAEYFKIAKVQILQSFDIDKFVLAFENGDVLVDFDARSHHNHGTKFRLRQEAIPRLYRFVDEVSLS